MSRAEAAAAETVVAHQAKGISVVHQRIVAGDFFVDGHQHLFFPNQLEKMAKLYALPLNDLTDGHRGGDFTGEIAFAVGRLQLSHERNRYHAVPGAAAAGPVDSHGADADNATAMPSLDLRDPGMPDLQFVLFVAALCTSNLQTINISENLRKTIFDRCWALVHTDPPPIDPKKRVLDLRGGTELTLEACASTIRSLLSEAGILTLVWDHPVSDPSRESTPAAKPLIERLGQLYPDTPDIVDPPNQLPPGHA